jgi:hypothetical protein
MGILILIPIIVLIMISRFIMNPEGKKQRGLKIFLGILIIPLLFALWGAADSILSGRGYGYGHRSPIDGAMETLGYLAISIICTGGASLIVYLPLAYLLGSGLLGLVHMISGNQTPPETIGMGTPETPRGRSLTMSREPDNAIQAYYEDSLKKGFTPKQTISTLKSVGWSDAEINASISK